MKGSNDLEMPDAIPAEMNDINYSQIAKTFRPGSYTLEDLPNELPFISKRTGRLKVFQKPIHKSKRVVSMPMLHADDTDTSTSASSWQYSMPEIKKKPRVVSMFQNGVKKLSQRNISVPTIENSKEKDLPPPPPIEKETKVEEPPKKDIPLFYHDLDSLNSIDSDLFRSGESLKLKIFEEYFYESPSSLPSSIYFTDSRSLKSSQSTETSIDDHDSTVEYLQKTLPKNSINDQKINLPSEFFNLEQNKQTSSFMPIKDQGTQYTESINTEITRINSLKLFCQLPKKRNKKPYFQPQEQKEFCLDSDRNYNYSRYVDPSKFNKRISSAYY